MSPYLPQFVPSFYIIIVICLLFLLSLVCLYLYWFYMFNLVLKNDNKDLIVKENDLVLKW